MAMMRLWIFRYVDVKLSPEDLAAIRKAAEKADGLHFDRYAPGMVEKVFVDTAIPL
uniref:Uncharacterized protein n=1 Tax=Psilocybe cubensis TaxID=181762 RepID=A0A8H8CFK7_PSICU